MTLTADGNLGLGTASPTAITNYRSITLDGTTGSILDLRGSGTLGARIVGTSGAMSIETGGATPMVFYTSGTERMRLNASGNLLVGTTSGPTNTIAVNKSNDQALYIQNNNTSNPFGVYIPYAISPNGTGSWFISCQDSTANRMRVHSNGGIANFQANDVNLSDRREKTNFAPAKSYLDTICAIPVQTFNYIDQNMEEDGGLTLGVVAQDVQAVAPELVMESNWGTKDEPKMRLSIYQTDLQYALMKALQELKAEFDAYKAAHP